MKLRNRFSSGLAAFMAMSITTGTITPMITPTPSFAQTVNSFSDVQSNYWASQFIQELAMRGVIAGFPDGSFRPEAPVTRAQFAAMLNKAFQKNQIRQATRFVDVRSNYWALNAIQQAYTTGFMSGYPGNRFAPEENIPRQQVLVSLANGLEYRPQSNVEGTLQFFNDSASIAGYARSPIAAATERQIVVNYPNLRFLNPERVATRAQVAAFIYQALVSTNQVAAINSPYIVALNTGEQAPIAVVIPEGTTIPVKYDKAEKILVTQDETAPLTLTVAQNIVTDRGRVVIPAGSQVVGQLKPVKGKKGSQFVADRLIMTGGQEYKINAQSEVITKTETIQKGSRLNSALKNAALGAGAAAAVSAVTGDRAIATEEVLGGAAIGGLIGAFFGRNSVDLIVINPNTDLQMTIGQNLQVSLK
ncbi:MAG: S-layer homology domain-containing protein [Calothrix sp. C42_A2020_038]|nr:S-layer homology domain-containing protein [Calothrix sp. C42_A2020_038]